MSACEVERFLERVGREPHVSLSDELGIVRDRDPACEDHYLLYARRGERALADLPPGMVEMFLTDTFAPAMVEPYGYFERGRNSLCTSLTGGSIGHAHVVPWRIGQGIWLADAERTGSLSTLLAGESGSEDGYLLWGALHGEFHRGCADGAPKRLIRSRLSDASAIRPELVR